MTEQQEQDLGKTEKVQQQEPKLPHPAHESDPRIWVAHMPFRKTGSPVIGGGFGATARGVVIMELETWKKLSADIPQLGSTRFNVGTFE